MSTKKSPKKPHARTPSRTYAREDFKKLSPNELEKLGKSRKSENFVDLKTKEIISKREFTKRFFGISNEERAKKILSGERPLLSNAPQAARRAKIVKSAQKRATKSTPKNATKYIAALELPDGRMRYDYDINVPMFMHATENAGTPLGDKALDYLTSDLNKILSQHKKDSFYRVTMTADSKNKDGEVVQQGASTQLNLIASVNGSDLIDDINEFLTKEAFKYEVTLKNNTIKITLRIYA